VLHALWEHHPASARELLGDLRGEGWAYTTLKTMLTRMEEKGLVRSRMEANTARYEPVLERRAAERDALRSLVKRVFQGAAGPLLAHLAEEESLSSAERAALKKQIAEQDAKGARRGR
jgi:predicted transcriptional regulator